MTAIHDRLAALVWWLRWRSRCLAVAAEWRAPWHAEPWAAYAHLARLEAQAQTRKERIA